MIPKLLVLPVGIRNSVGIAGFIVKTADRRVIFEIYLVQLNSEERYELEIDIVMSFNSDSCETWGLSTA